MAHFAGYIFSESDARHAARPILAKLSRNDFDCARGRHPAFSVWSNHADFVEEREAQVFGYGTAGATARVMLVPFADFDRWVRLTGARADLAGLDHFAAHRLWRYENPFSPSRGRLVAHEAADIRRVEQAGVQWIDIFADRYEKWRDAVSGALQLQGPPSVDVYAGLVIETCIGLAAERRGRRVARRRRSPWPTPVNSK
jgi:hypothetical protein